MVLQNKLVNSLVWIFGTSQLLQESYVDAKFSLLDVIYHTLYEITYCLILKLG